MEGTGPAGGHRGAEPGRCVHAGAAQRLEPRVLRRAAEQGPGGVLAAAGPLQLPGICFHHHRGLQVLPHAAAGGELAGLDDAAVSAALAGPRCVLPHGAGPLHRHDGRQPRQPGPAYPGRREPVHGLFRVAVDGPAQRCGHTREFCRHPVGTEWSLQLRGARQHVHHSGFYGLDGGVVLRGGQRHHALCRQTPNQTQLRTAEAGGQLPAPHGAGA